MRLLSSGRAVASDTRDPRFESSHQHVLYTINCNTTFYKVLILAQKVRVLVDQLQLSFFNFGQIYFHFQFSVQFHNPMTNSIYKL